MVPTFVKRTVRGKVIQKVADELALRLTAQTEQAVDLVVRTRGPAIATAVEIERLRHPELPPRELAELLIQKRTKVVAGTGAASALPGVVPGLGTSAEIAAAVADAGALIYNQVALILAVAHVYGRDLSDQDARKFDVFLTLALEAGLAVPSGKTIEVLGEKVMLGALPKETVAHVNRRLGGEIAKRLARRRTRVILGREIPLGVGVAIGAGFNYTATRKIGKAAIRYFEMG